MGETLVFIDEGFLGKLSKHFGGGKYLKINYLDFAKLLAKKQDLFCRHLFYYTAPPYQSEKPLEMEIAKKRGHDRFIEVFGRNKMVTIRQGRCQKIIHEDGEEEYSQKGVDALIVSGMVSVPIKYPKIEKIILVTSDTDFCPIIMDLEDLGVEVILATYYEKKRKGKFSVSHHLIDSCKGVYYITEKDFKDCELKKKKDNK